MERHVRIDEGKWIYNGVTFSDLACFLFLEFMCVKWAWRELDGLHGRFGVDDLDDWF